MALPQRKAGSHRFLHAASSLLPALFIILRAGASTADPTWWKSATDIPELTAQTGKAVVLYFESPKAVDCVKMNSQTWPKISPAAADPNFIWVRLNPADNETFFTYYEVYQTPEIVVLDHELKEMKRLRGFVAPEELLATLGKIPRGKASVMTTADGKVADAPDAAKAAQHKADLTNEGHYFFESFDDYASLGAIRSTLFQPIVQSSSRIDSTGGMYGSPCLIVDSGSQPNASIRIDISPGLNEVAQIEGRMRINVRLRAIEVGEEVANVAAISIVPIGEAPTSSKAKRFFLTLANRFNSWYEREVITDPFNFKTQKAYLTFQVNWPGQSFGIDDLKIDLLPSSDTIPSATPSASNAANHGGPDPTSLLAPPTEPELFRKYDKNHDGRLTPDEMTSNMPLFNFLDLNHDGVVTLQEATDGVRKMFKRGSKKTDNQKK